MKARGDENGRCARCGSSAVVADVGAKCPACERKLTLLRADEDVTVDVNWFELRVLGIWAERWSATIQGSEGEEMQRLVAAICGRLHAQEPDRPPLTMSGEIAQLRQASPSSRVEVRGFREDHEANAPAPDTDEGEL